MTSYFKKDFDPYVVEGDSITTTVDGIDFTARLVFDHDSTPRDYDNPGWVFDTTSKQYGRKNRAIIKAWDNDEWQYFGVVLDASRDGWVKTGVASLWGIEGNFPSRAKNPNKYFRDVANDLVGEVLAILKES